MFEFSGIYLSGKQTATKNQRIVAPKKSPQLITTSSWRVGEELKKKIYAEMRKANNKKKLTEKESGNQNQAAALSSIEFNVYIIVKPVV